MGFIVDLPDRNEPYPMIRKSLFSRLERTVLILIRLLVGGVFIYASVDKILHPDQFAIAVNNYRLLPEILVNSFAIVLPWAELLAGFLLVLGQWQRSSSFVLASLVIVFIIAVGIGLLRGLDISCGCFNTASGRKIGLQVLFGDFFLLAVTLILILRSSDKLGKQAFLGKR